MKKTKHALGMIRKSLRLGVGNLLLLCLLCELSFLLHRPRKRFLMPNFRLGKDALAFARCFLRLFRLLRRGFRFALFF